VGGFYMSFSIVRVAKVKSKVNTTGLQKHIQRENENYENKDINHDKTYLNYDLVNESDIDFNQKIDEKIEENYNGKRKIRSDAVKHIDGLITSDNEFFDNKSPDEIKAFFTDAKQFIEDEYGQQNLLYATVHMDEKTPHMHYGVVPITDDGRLSAKDVVGNKKALTQFQDRFNQYLNDKGHNLERGISKYKTQEEHKSVEKFKKDTNYHQEVEKKAIKKREQQEKATEKVVNALKELKTEGRKELQNFNSIKQRKEDLQKELEEYELKKEREQEQIDTYKANREQIRVDIEKQKEKHQEMLNVLNEPVNVKYEYEYKKASLFSGERHKTDNVIVSKSTLDQLQEQAMLGRRIAPHYERLQNGEEHKRLNELVKFQRNKIDEQAEKMRNAEVNYKKIQNENKELIQDQKDTNQLLNKACGVVKGWVGEKAYHKGINYVDDRLGRKQKIRNIMTVDENDKIYFENKDKRIKQHEFEQSLAAKNHDNRNKGFDLEL
jgi:hypothetical protein